LPQIPAKTFHQKLATPNEIVDALNTALLALMEVNPKLKVIFTVSPVRYFAFGHFENSLSKAHLFTAIGELLANNAAFSYFPAYEIIMDELRDYRFYADDMIHPNAIAIEYVWEKLVQYYFNSNTIGINKEIEDIQKIITTSST
jgi:lysophospholipase L1-like esterase